MTIVTERFQEFVDALEMIDDEDLRFEYIIDIGKKLESDSFPEELRIDKNLMHGCMSKVWIVDEKRGEKYYFKGYSDAIIVKGLVAMMTDSFSGLNNDELQELTYPILCQRVHF